jgi:large subunit ribosomal protein L23
MGLTIMSEYQLVVHYPLMTEDAVALIEAENKLTFIVDTKASKARIKKAVESLYQVKVSKVNVSITPKGVKKAFVTLLPEFKASDIAIRLGIF